MYSALVVCGLLAAAWLTFSFRNRRLIRMARKIPGPPTVPLLGNALLLIGKPEVIFERIQAMISEYGEVIRIWLGPELNIIVSNPDDLKLLLSSPKTSVKGPQYKYMAEFIGGGILSGSGPTWRRHRKIANPNYGKRAIESYSDIFNSETSELLTNLRQTEGQIDVYKYIVRTTSYSVCQTLIGLTKSETVDLPHLDEIIEATQNLYKIVFDRMTKWYLQIGPVYWMTKPYQEQTNFIKLMTEFSNAMIKHRMEKLKHYNHDIDVLNDDNEDTTTNTKLTVIDRFILSREFDNIELVQETFTIFTSSQEASAKIASYLILMMAFHPTCQEKLYCEIINVLGAKNRPVSDEDLRQMPYLEMVFKEVLRLFPIGAMLQRTVTEDIDISSCTIPAGTSLVAPIYQLQRHPGFWTNPEDFDPERFTPENSKLRNPNCFMPFSAGPMDCLGRYYGTKLIKTICVGILKEFEVTSSLTYKDLKLMIAVSVKSLSGYPVILKPRY